MRPGPDASLRTRARVPRPHSSDRFGSAARSCPDRANGIASPPGSAGALHPGLAACRRRDVRTATHRRRSGPRRSEPAAGRGRSRASRRAAKQVDAAADRRVGGRRAARRPVVGDDRAGPRGDGQRDLVRLRRRVHLFHRLPLLLDVHREQDRAAERPARDARRVQRERPGLHADGPACALRPPLRRDRRRRSARRPGARRAVGLPARHALDHRRRDPGRGGAGLPGAVLLDAPRRAARWARWPARNSASSAAWPP